MMVPKYQVRWYNIGLDVGIEESWIVLDLERGERAANKKEDVSIVCENTEVTLSLPDCHLEYLEITIGGPRIPVLSWLTTQVRDLTQDCLTL